MEEVVIPKEKAVFWLDQRGRWRNRFGLFEHQKIIDYFHACIRKDSEGFFLEQVLDGRKEKVYFPYEDAVLFVFDTIQAPEGIFLILNTGKRVRLKPKKLYIENDSLYMDLRQDRIKFSEKGLLRISDLLLDAEGGFWIRVGNRKFRIPERSPPVKALQKGSGRF